ncbi:AbrB/MazE/SpoVT family DNA-binding domain-containing protein [Brevundimonas sp. R86498]|uniref:AbrB/MazE/SpoVT family DNA-binding domain-containing protein n=1 Tax=Brevundimonas sp. R86498 TaxID=3093845 RepID=UPI0037C9B4DB
MTTIIKPTSKGQITLKKGVLDHMGVRSGDRLELVMMPGGKVQLEPLRERKPMSSLFSLFEPRPGPPVTEAEIQAGIGRGAVESGLPQADGSALDDGEAA